MKILVSGAAGYIGSHTVISLLENGYEVVGFDNFYNSSPKAVQRVKEISGKDFPFYEADMLDKEALHQIFKAHPDIYAVIHFAGLKAVGESVQKPILYYHDNLTGTLNLVQVMEEAGCCNIIFSSSATVYGDPKEIPITENCPKGICTNPYGWTKWMQEQMLIDLQKASPEWNVILLRYFNPIGAHKSGEIGEKPQGIPNNLVPFLTQVAVGKRPKLYIYGTDYDTPDGTCIRDYIHILDLAQGHVEALRYLDQKEGGHTVINLGSGKGYSVFDIINTFEGIMGSEIPKEIADRRKGDIPISLADITKAKKLLGWEPKYTLEEMCRDSWKWQQKYPEGFNK